MSWRLIIAFLLLAAGVSAWAGLQLGDWLIAHGPAQVVAPPTYPELDGSATLDAQGRPIVATAPQLLPNGRQGIPDMPPPVDWSISTVSLMDSPSPISLATTTISLDEAIQQAALQQMGTETPDALAALNQDGNRFVQPIDAPQAPPTPDAGASGNQGWQAQFHAKLKACENLGFFSRPSCAWAARNQYCEPNAAWGKVEGCPEKKSSF